MNKYNFSPGPAKLNNSVLEIVNQNILEYENEYDQDSLNTQDKKE